MNELFQYMKTTLRRAISRKSLNVPANVGARRAQMKRNLMKRTILNFFNQTKDHAETIVDTLRYPQSPDGASRVSQNRLVLRERIANYLFRHAKYFDF